MQDQPINIRGEELQLLAEKAMYWPKHKSLYIADLHLGKANHFRKNGIGVPGHVEHANLRKLNQLIARIGAERIVFLGDLFHAQHNQAWSTLEAFVVAHSTKQFVLVSGNHDILDASHYNKAGIEVVKDLAEPPFYFTHHPKKKAAELYNIAGHIHPGVRLVGKGRQTHRLPCFWFCDWQGLLPAFGAFTGLALLSPKEEEQTFVVSEGTVLAV